MSDTHPLTAKGSYSAYAFLSRNNTTAEYLNELSTVQSEYKRAFSDFIPLPARTTKNLIT